MSKKIKILSPIVIILLFVIIFMFYQKSNDDDKYDTSDLLAKQETLNQDETTELASKTLILCANNFDTNKTKAIKSEKIGENVYYLTYNSSKEADRALDKYSKDENIIYCEKDTAIQTSEVDDTPSIQEAIINQHKNSETGDIYNNIDVNEDENKIDRNKATIVVIDSGANGTYKNAYNAFNGSSDVTDTVGHGTKMIETIKENISEENYEIVPIKIANDNGYATVSSLIKALNYAVKLNPTIVNISLTSTNKGSAEILNQYITKLGDNGTAVVVSAGNNHDNVANYVPANSSNAITVGSCDTTGKIKTFSNYGEGINWLVTSDSTSEAAAITSGLYATAFLKNESPLKILKESGKVFDYKQDTLENLDNLTIDDEAVWWCGGTYSNSGALGGAGTQYKLKTSITTWNVTYNGVKRGNETWPSGVTVKVIKHKKDGYIYYTYNNITYVTLSNIAPNNTNGNNEYKGSYGWFEVNEVKKATGYTVTYNGNGGTWNGTNTWSETVSYGDMYTTQENFFTRSGYSFVGWNEKADGTGTDWTTYIGKQWKYQYNSDVTLYAQWKKLYTVNVDHWMWGFTNKEGNNSNKDAYKIGNTNWKQPANSEFEMGRNRHYAMPKGFDYNPNGIWCGTTSKTYAYGTNFTADNDYYFQYSIYPINYTITYDLDGGTQDTHNPNSYNVIYEKYLYTPGKAGYTFTGWTQTNNILGNGNYNYTFKNTLSGNKFSYSKVQLFGINQSDKTWKYISTIVATSTTGKVSETYTHNEPSGVYSIRVGANGNKEDKVADIYNIYFEKGAQYKIEYDTTYSEQKITMSNVSIKRVTAVTALNKGKNGTALATSNYYAESCTRQIGNVTLKANWKANKYKVSYNANGGTGTMSTDTILYGQDYTAKENAFTRNGYTFIGWNENADGTGVDWTTWIGKPWMWQYTKNITLYAQWKKNDTKYTNTLNYDANGGSGAPASQTATVTYPNTASTFTVSTTKPSRTGYTFVGWYTAASGGTKVGTKYIVGSNNQEKNQSATIYAHWKANVYTVTLQPSGGSLNIEDGSITKNSNGSATFKVTYDTTNYYNLGITASKTGYQVNGFYNNTSGGKKLWNNGGACLNDGTYWLNNKWHYAGDVTLYVQWTANTYTIKYDGNGATGGSTANSNHTYDSDKTLTPNGFVKTGYTFNGWNTQANGKGTSYPDKAYVKNLTAVNNSTVTLYAQWKANTYTVTYDSNKPANASTTISGTMSKDTATYDQNYTTRANGYTLPGYTFVGWNEKADGTGTDWTGYINKPWRWTYTKNVTLYAQWKANTYTVTYDSNKPANASTTISGTMSKDTATYNQNYTTRANGYTLSGYTFVGWNEKADGTGTDWTGYINKPWRWTYTKNVTLYAQWKANTYTIKLDGNENTSGTMSNINATFDKEIKLPASTFRKTEYHFIGWSTTKNGEVKYKDGETIKNLTPDQGKTVTLYAVWKELPKAKGVDIAIIKDDGVKMINNNTLESFVHTELQLTIANNEDNITLQSYKILNLDEIKSKINNTESQSEIEIKVEVTYSTGDKSYKVINKDGNPCMLKVLTLVLGDSEQTYTRYIEDDGTLKANSSWRTTTKKTLLEEALNKDLDEIPSKDITK